MSAFDPKRTLGPIDKELNSMAQLARSWFLHIAAALLLISSVRPCLALGGTVTDPPAQTGAMGPSARLTGLYRFGGDGELCFLPSARSVAQLPEWKGGSRLCFVNHDAFDVLHVRDVALGEGEPRICGFEGHASVVVENLRWADKEGEWRYEGTLVEATDLGAPSWIRCGDVQDRCYTLRDAEAMEALVPIERPSVVEDYRWTPVPGIDLDADGLADRMALGSSFSTSHSPGDPQELSYTVSSTGKTFAVDFPVIGLKRQDGSYYVRGVTYPASDAGPYATKRVDVLSITRNGLLPVCSYELP
ncbi:hypothetical protein JI752_009575 [Lysobacter sp. MMG2]|uniref:hypothetical protein n=1 Tax=Lysobacter sp. MMG2 TaxID=2801338 RepID=UPI001C21EB7F|nr:hypothetical protein [Lysobacter sp. MMG2]MBU8976386.1 hypothetical protein [Lysobacter sp. MMG2]